MAVLVVDSSVVIKWFVPEPLSQEARALLSGYEEGEITLCSPDLMHAEVGNILWKKQRAQGLSAEDAREIIRAILALRIQLTPCATLFLSAFDLAVAHQRTVYDSLYLALALRHSCPFVTADERLVNALRTSFSNVLWLPEWTPS